MKRHDVTLTGRASIAEGTMAFRFERPADWSHQAGQAVNLVLPGLPAADARHAYSLVSAPYENELVIATRMRDSVHKRALAALPAGATARIEGPFGTLTLHEDRGRPAVLIAGGIGITPFVSIVRQATKEESPQQLVLLYASRRPEDAAFLDELQRLGRRNGRLRLLATMTGMAQSRRPWQGETRRIDAQLLGAAAAGLAAPVYYLVGPPAMVEAVAVLLDRTGVAPKDVRTESFYGY